MFGKSEEPKTKEEPKKQVEVFKFENLRLLTDGLFKYDCDEVNNIPKNFFACPLAKEYGIKVGNIVMITDKDSVKTIVVR